MNNLLDTVLTIVVGSFTNLTRNFVQNFSALEDFFYVKVWGLSFIVLGARQTGKTTLIEWLRRNMHSVEGFAPNPTAAGGDAVPGFSARLDDGQYMRVKPNRDVGGEYAMWETDWLTLFREAQPRGILFLIDHTEPYQHKDALNFVMQMIEDEAQARKNLKAFYVFVNKADLWSADTTLDDILQYYRNEQKRMKNQAERLGYQASFFSGSVMTGAGVTEMMQRFFNLIRPKTKA